MQTRWHKLLLSVVAFAETNAYPMYIRHHKLTSDVYNHADCKVDLERGLLQHARQAEQATDGDEKEAGVVTRGSRGSVATGAAVVQRLPRACLPCSKGMRSSCRRTPPAGA
jgi:hypothetical protein